MILFLSGYLAFEPIGPNWFDNIHFVLCGFGVACFLSSPVHGMLLFV